MTAPIEEISDSDFESRVLQASLPVVLDVFAPWCAPCRAGLPFLERAAARVAGQVTFLKYDADQSDFSRSRLGVMSLPTLIVFQNGLEIWRARDLSPPTIEKAVRSALDASHTTAQAAPMPRGPDDVSSIQPLMESIRHLLKEHPAHERLSHDDAHRLCTAVSTPPLVAAVVGACLTLLPLNDAAPLVLDVLMPPLLSSPCDMARLTQDYVCWALGDREWGVVRFSADGTALRAAIERLASVAADVPAPNSGAAVPSDLVTRLMTLSEADLPSTLTTAKAALATLSSGYGRGLPDFIKTALCLPERYREEEMATRPEIRAHRDEIDALLQSLEMPDDPRQKAAFFERNGPVLARASAAFQERHPAALVPAGPLPGASAEELRCAAVNAHVRALVERVKRGAAS